MAFDLRRGTEEAASASKFAAFQRTQFFSLDDGESAIIRLITDANPVEIGGTLVGGWITVDQHQMIPTKGAPADYKGTSWPEKMGAVCRNDKAFRSTYGDCYICAHMVDGTKIKKPSGRTWAWACVREEVREDGKLLGYRDKTREVTRKKEGSDEQETIIEKDVVVVNLGWKNFFSILDGYADAYETVLDRDFKVKRKGNSTDTTYSVIPFDPIPGHDLRDPEVLKKYGFDSLQDADAKLVEVIAERASDDFYARFFDRTKTVTKDDKVVESGETPESIKQDNDVDEQRLAALRDRVKSAAGGGEAPQQQAPAPPSQDTQADATQPAEAPAEPAAAAAGGFRNFD